MAESASAGDRRPLVAVTRSVEENRSLASRLEALGFEVVTVPLVEVVDPRDRGRALAAAVADVARYRWVVLTSVNGVRALVDALDGTPWPAGVSVAAVGPSTAAAASGAGLSVQLVPEVATAAALVERFPSAPSAPKPVRVLAPLAERAGETVELGLRAKGWVVDRVEAYRTAAPPATTVDRPAAEPSPVDAVSLFSPSVVDRWVDRFGAAVPLAVCVGPSTAARARDRGFARTVVASPHTEAGVVAAIERSLTSSG